MTMNRRFVVMGLAALLTTGVIASARAADEAPAVRMVVLPFANLTKDHTYDDLSGVLDAFLSDVLSDRAGIALVDRANMRKVIAEQKLTLAGLTGERGAEVGRLLGANRFLMGSVLTVKEDLKLVAQVFDTETLAAVTSAEVSGKPGAVLDLCRRISEQLAKDLTGREIDVGEVDNTPEVSLHFVRALGCYYAKDLPRSIASLTQLLLLDADHEEGRYWLARCYVEIKMPGHAKIEIEEFLTRFPESKRAAQIREWHIEVSLKSNPPSETKQE